MNLMEVLKRECVATGLVLPDKRSALDAVAKLAAQSPALAGAGASVIADNSSIAEAIPVASAISAIAHPACMFGKHTVCSGDERMSADSALKCTPQKTIYLASS